MHVDVIEGLQALAALRRDWEAVYEADPEASFFLSWTWLYGWFERVDKPCLVLAAKPHPRAKAYVAFLPLAVWTRHTKAGFCSTLAMAGNRMADYTGIIAVPEFVPRAIDAFAARLKRLDWTDLNLENLRVSEADLARLLQHFPAKSFDVKHGRARIDPRDNINHSVCPYIALPDDWGRYLESIGPNSRQKARRFLRKLDAGALRVTHADAATIDADIETLLRFWSIKWGPRKGSRLPGLVQMHRSMLKYCFASGCLFMPVLWQDERPLGVLAILVDRPKRSLLFFIGARDETVSNPPPGFVLHAYAIRYAIANGFAVYDFLRGNESYKYLFASQERPIRNVAVTAKDGRPGLDRRSIPAVLQIAGELHQAGRLDEAERGYRQVLALEPQEPTALFALGRILAAKRDHAAAERLFRAVLAVRPGSAAAWFKLGKTLQACDRLADAAAAYREVLRSKPDFAFAYYGLGETLRALGREEEAAAAFNKAAALNRHDAQAEIGAASAQHLASRLAWDVRAPHPLLRAELERRLGPAGAPAPPLLHAPARA